MKLILGLVLCLLLWIFWRKAQHEKKRNIELRKKIRDRAFGESSGKTDYSSKIDDLEEDS